MANSNNGALKHGENEDHKRGVDVAADAVKAVPGRSSAKSSARSSKDSPSRGIPNPKEPAQQLPGRPRKQSRRGQGGGPKTKAGKAIVSRNAVKHGITSASPVIPGMESDEEWQAYRSGIIESLEPEGSTLLGKQVLYR